MLTLHSVHFDNRIPNWRTSLTMLTNNVLVLMIEGKIKYTVNDHTVIGEKGELLYLPVGALRTGENFEGAHQKITILFNHGEEDSEELPFLGKAQFNKGKTRNFEYMKHRFERLFFEMTEDGKFNRYFVNGILQELVGMVAREFELIEVQPAKLKLANELQKYLVAYYRQPIHIDQLAAMINRSANYTISIFREVIGVSPIQYVHLLRMKEACHLLANSDLSVTEISNYLGYYDHSYFFRIFKKYTSMSPTEYKHSGALPQSLQLYFKIKKEGQPADHA